MGHQETRSAKRPQRRTTGDFAKKKTLYDLSLCQQCRHSYSQFEELEKMRAFLVFALAASATAQLKFGSDPTEAPKKDVNTRLGLLGTSLGLSPTAEQTSGSSSSGGQSSAFTQGSGQTPTGRVPSGGEFTGSFSSCCCVPLSEQCGDPLGRDIDYDYDLVGSGLIDPRLKPLREESVKRTQSKRRPWTEDCEPTQRQHQLSNQHLPHWTEGLLLRSLSQPRFLWPLVHCSRIYCQPVRKCPIRLQRAGCEFRQAVRNKELPSTSSWPPAWRGEPRGVPLDLPRSQPEQRLHRQLCCHSQRQQQQQWTRHKEGCHRCPQAQECPTEWALEDPCWRVRCQWLQPPRDSAARGVHYCQASQAPSIQCRKTEQRRCHPVH